MDSLALSDLDPKIATLAREKIIAVQAFIAAGWDQHLGTARERRVAEQAAERNGELPIVSIQAHERADAAIRTHFREYGKTRGGRFSKLCGWMIGLLILAFIIGNVIILVVEAHPLYLVLANIASLLTIAASTYGIVRVNRQRRNLPFEIVTRLLPCISNTPGEQAYSAAVAEVANAQTTLGAQEARAMLTSLNSLLESERAVTAQGEAISRAMQTQTLPALEAECERLRARHDAAEDPIARQTFGESLALCEARVERARSMAPVRERIEAQQESIRQTMASVQTSLASLAVASMETLSTETASGTRTAALLATTRDLQNRAVAVEKAVQEVATLHVGR